MFDSLLSTLFLEKEKQVPNPCTKGTRSPCGDFLEYNDPKSVLESKTHVPILLQENIPDNKNFPPFGVFMKYP